MKSQITGTEEALFASLFPRVVSKSDRRKIQILQATIACYASLGIEKTAYEHIASQCEVSRTLVIHYFPDREELSRLAIQFVRADMQNAALLAIQAAKTPEKRLIAYIESTFEWIKKKPDYMTVWVLFSYYCGVKPAFKAINTELAAMGHERIVALLQGLPQNANVSLKDLSLRAKSLQALITGSLAVAHTETLSLNREAFVAQTVRDCLRIAKGS